MATDRLRTSPLDTEHFNTRAMLPERVCDLIADGHTVKVADRHLVVNDKPDDDSSGYIVTEIETTVEPDADAETITLFVCHCAHAHHRVFNWSQVGGPDGAAPSDDKHVARVLRSEKRARDVDDDQSTLVPDGGCPIPMCPACETRMVTPPGEPRGSLERAASWECPECGRHPVPDGGRSKCVECGGWLPQVIDPGTGVYCPQCGHGQLLADGGRVLDDDRETEAWERIGRETVARRIGHDREAIVETFEAVAAKIRRGERLEPGDVEMMRREIEHAEYHLDDVLEPLACGDVERRADVRRLDRGGRR